MIGALVILILALSVPVWFCLRLFDAIKSGAFYAKGNPVKPKLLAKYIDNMHYAQTPLWYLQFGGYFILLFTITNLYNPSIYDSCCEIKVDWLQLVVNTLAAYFISAGTSAMCGPFYQGFINVADGHPFIDPNENKRMELANPLSNKKRWFNRFWYGKRRIIFAFFGLLEVVIGFYLIFK